MSHVAHPPPLKCTYVTNNHWELDPSLLPSSYTDQTIAELVFQFFQNTPPSPKNIYTPTISWQGKESSVGEQESEKRVKRRAFFVPGAVYFPESHKTMERKNAYEGGYKTGRPILHAFNRQADEPMTEDARPLLLFKNQQNEEVRTSRKCYDAMEREISAIFHFKEQQIPNVQVPIHKLQWVTRKNQRKRGFICERHLENFFLKFRYPAWKMPRKGLTEKDSVFKTFPKIPEQMAQVLISISEANYLYRDCKPGNFLLSKEGKPILIDFDGCTHKTEGPTEPQFFVGSRVACAPEYLFFLCWYKCLPPSYSISPELVSLFVGEFTTIWALGITFLEMDPYIRNLAPHLFRLETAQYQQMPDVIRRRIRWVPEAFRKRVQDKHPEVKWELTRRAQGEHREMYREEIPCEKEIPCEDPILPCHQPSSNPWVQLIEKMLALDPQERPSLEEVLQAIEIINKEPDANS